jgi:hypothetical protein
LPLHQPAGFITETITDGKIKILLGLAAFIWKRFHVKHKGLSPSAVKASGTSATDNFADVLHALLISIAAQIYRRNKLTGRPNKYATSQEGAILASSWLLERFTLLS